MVVFEEQKHIKTNLKLNLTEWKYIFTFDTDINIAHKTNSNNITSKIILNIIILFSSLVATTPGLMLILSMEVVCDKAFIIPLTI